LNTLLRIEGLSFRYVDTQKWAADSIDLEIEEGTITILAGQSGCGKSTLLRCINGLIPHMYPGEYKGRVALDGAVVETTQMGELAQKVGLLFQNPENQIFMFSVERDIAFGLENLGLPREEIRTRVDEAMRLLGITQLALRAPHELSDGQKQRVALAGVIAMRPKLIILDEPTSLLDPQTASELVGLVHKLNRELGITFLVVEHRLELLTPVADKVVVMDRGRKVMEGRPAEVLTDPRAIGYGIAVPPVWMLYADLRRDGLPLAKVPAVPRELAEEVNGL